MDNSISNEEVTIYAPVIQEVYSKYSQKWREIFSDVGDIDVDAVRPLINAKYDNVGQSPPTIHVTNDVYETLDLICSLYLKNDDIILTREEAVKPMIRGLVNVDADFRDYVMLDIMLNELDVSPISEKGMLDFEFAKHINTWIPFDTDCILLQFPRPTI